MAGLFSKTYTAVTWTSGDVITETKLDNMVNNDQAHDQLAAEGITFNNTVEIKAKDSGGTARDVAQIDSNDDIQIGENNVAGHTVINAGTSKLVKIKVVRQDHTTNAYTANTVVLHGHGSVIPNSEVAKTKAVTYAITFTASPHVLISYAGRNTSGNTAWGDNSVIGSNKICAGIYGPSTTGFTANLGTGDASNFGDGTSTWFYTWLAIGAL